MIGVQEALKSGVVGRVAEECRVALETQVVEQLLEEIAKDGLFAYGAEEVRNALEVGAVETLLVTNEMVREGDGIELLELAERGRSRIMVVSSVHEGGKKLKALGGVGAILRYKV
jgi:protein pelota